MSGKIGIGKLANKAWCCCQKLGAVVSGLQAQVSALAAQIGEIEHPVEVKGCSGPFVGSSRRSGWAQGWSPIVTANQAPSTLVDWRPLGNGTVTSPDCVTDAKFNLDFGNYQTRLRNARMYIWEDYRLLVNGTVVQTVGSDQYVYLDERVTTLEAAEAGRPSKILMDEVGNSAFERKGIPAGSVVSIERRVRWSVTGAQTNAQARLITGLRSRFVVSFHLPNQLEAA